MKAFYLWGLITLMIVTSCGPPLGAEQVASTEAPLIIKRNGKYNLSCLFYGEKFTSADGASEDRIEYVALRDDATGKEVKYQSPDPAFASSRGYYSDVWSPNEDHLLLPLGRFKGFCIVKAAAALKSVEQNHCDDTLKVYAESADGITGLWHEFQNWKGNGRFSFKAGLSGKDVLLEYDIAEAKLTALERFPTLSGENAKGKLIITPR